jgi:hypothetical protein
VQVVLLLSRTNCITRLQERRKMVDVELSDDCVQHQRAPKFLLPLVEGRDGTAGRYLKNI